MSCNDRSNGGYGVPVWRQRLHSGFMATLAAGWLGFVLYSMATGDTEPGLGLHGAGLLLTIGLVMTCTGTVLGLVYRRRPRVATVLYILAAGAGVGVYALTSHGPSGAFLFFAVGAAAYRLSFRRSAPVITAATVGFAGVVVVQGRDVSELWTLVGLLGMYFGVVAGKSREMARMAEREAERTSAVLGERQRIAREIHDILAHSLSAQIVHLEGARLLLKNEETGQALDRVERAQTLARSGLEETKRALATLRGETPPIDVVLRELADEFDATTGHPCEVTVRGSEHRLGPEAGLAVIRTAQEALTNVRKHAPGARAEVDLRYLDGWCELEVTDIGARNRPAELAGTGGGYGLVGMRERAELIGGTLETGTEGDGFRTLLRVPA